MMMRNLSRLLKLLLLILLGLGCGSREAVGPIAMRRITADQYRQTIADVFGSDIRVVGRFEPDARRDGLLAVGTAWVSVTPAGFEQYDSIARRIAAQVVAPENRERFVPCTPRTPRCPMATAASGSSENSDHGYCVGRWTKTTSPGISPSRKRPHGRWATSTSVCDSSSRACWFLQSSCSAWSAPSAIPGIRSGCA